MKRTYTKFEKQQLTEVFGRFPEQEVLIFGACDRIFVAAYEIIKHLGGSLSITLEIDRDEINSYPGIIIAVQKKKYKYPLKHDPDYYLVDHIFIREYFLGMERNFERFKLAPFLPSA